MPTGSRARARRPAHHHHCVPFAVGGASAYTTLQLAKRFAKTFALPRSPLDVVVTKPTPSVLRRPRPQPLENGALTWPLRRNHRDRFGRSLAGTGTGCLRIVGDQNRDGRERSGASWPTCPRDSHATQPTLLDGRATWVCPPLVLARPYPNRRLLWRDRCGLPSRSQHEDSPDETGLEW